MPDSHREWTAWSGDRFAAGRRGREAILAVVDGILKSRKVEQQVYRSARALLGLADKHGDALWKGRAQGAHRTARPSHKTVKTALQKMVAETAPIRMRRSPKARRLLRRVRRMRPIGGSAKMANEATMDKLYQMRMSVMARAYREQQEESIGVAEMPFDDRLAMLVDAEWGRARRANKRTRLLRRGGLLRSRCQRVRCPLRSRPCARSRQGDGAVELHMGGRGQKPHNHGRFRCGGSRGWHALWEWLPAMRSRQ